MVIASGLLGRLVGITATSRSIVTPKHQETLTDQPFSFENNIEEVGAELQIYYKSNGQSFIPKNRTLPDALNNYGVASGAPIFTLYKLMPTLESVLHPNLKDIAVQYDKNNGYTKFPQPSAKVAEAVTWDPTYDWCIAVVLVETAYPVKTSFENALFYSGNKRINTALPEKKDLNMYFNISHFKSVSSCNFKMKNRIFRDQMPGYQQ